MLQAEAIILPAEGWAVNLWGGWPFIALNFGLRTEVVNQRFVNYSKMTQKYFYY